MFKNTRKIHTPLLLFLAFVVSLLTLTFYSFLIFLCYDYYFLPFYTEVKKKEENKGNGGRRKEECVHSGERKKKVNEKAIFLYLDS